MVESIQDINTFTAISAPQHFYRWRGHRISYYADGTGSPLLMVHSINAAASAFEMRSPFFGQRNRHRVFALDLLGYGGSDRPARRYSAEDYVALISDFARDVVGPGAPIIGSSLGAAYVVRAAARTPDLFGPLILSCPTGISQLSKPVSPGPGYALLRSPIGDKIFDLLTSRASTKLFLKRQAYYDPNFINEETLQGFYATCHQPGAKYAPICFVTQLLNCDISEDFGKLRQPVLLVWGKQSTTTPLRLAQEFLQRKPTARLEVIDRARLMPHDEHPNQFNQMVTDFLATNR